MSSTASKMPSNKVSIKQASLRGAESSPEDLQRLRLASEHGDAKAYGGPTARVLVTDFGNPKGAIHRTLACDRCNLNRASLGGFRGGDVNAFCQASGQMQREST